MKQQVDSGNGGMVMKCPNCGKDTRENGFFCGWCSASLRESAPAIDRQSSAVETAGITETVPLIKSDYLKMIVKVSGIGSAIIGIVFAIVSVYAIAVGSGVTFVINDRVVSAEEGGPIFLAIGSVLLVVGLVLRYAYYMTRPLKAY